MEVILTWGQVEKEGWGCKYFMVDETGITHEGNRQKSM